MSPRKRPARPVLDPFTVFLDRDGVFNTHPKVAVKSFEDFPWLPDAKEAFSRLNRPGIRTCLATNQPTVGMGITRRRTIERLHAQFQEALHEAGGRLDRIEASYGVVSRRRKPNPGMLIDAAKAFELEGHPVNKSRAVMVGDKPKDAQAAARFGIPAILVATTHSRADLHEKINKLRLEDVCIVADLMEAVDEIYNRLDDATRERRKE